MLGFAFSREKCPIWEFTWYTHCVEESEAAFILYSFVRSTGFLRVRTKIGTLKNLMTGYRSLEYFFYHLVRKFLKHFDTPT